MRSTAFAGLCVAAGLSAACAKPIRIPQSVVPSERRVNVCPVFFMVQFGPRYLSVGEAIDADDVQAVLGFRGVERPAGRSDASIAYRAAGFDKTRTLAAMLDAGVDPDTRLFGEETLLHRAALSGARGAADLLLDRGADINARDDGGFTPLACAAIRSDERMFKLLLSRGADIRVPDIQGCAIAGNPYLSAEQQDKVGKWIAEGQ